MRSRPLLLALGLVVAGTGVSSRAHAALTDSEKARIQDFYAKGDAALAPEVRALLARPDLTPGESTNAFSDAARRVTFDDRHAAFVRELVFGPASQASRSDLLPSVVRGLLARSAEVAGATSGTALARADELLRIHRFVLQEIAEADAPRPGEGGAALRPDALRAVVAAYRDHLALPVLDRARLTGPLTIARTEAELAMIAVAHGVASTADVAAWIGAGPTQREALAKTGVLVAGLGAAAPAKASAVEALLEAIPAATRGASALWIGKPWPRGLAAERAVLVAQAPLSGSRPAEGQRLWPSAVEPSSPDAAIAEIAFVLGRSAAHAIAARDAASAAAIDQALARARAGGGAAFLAPGVLAEAIDRDATGGTNVAIDPASFLGHAIRLVLLDAPRAVSVALVRSLVGRDEPAEQLALALGAIADDGSGKLRESATVFRPVDGGGVVPIELTKLRGSPLALEGFTMDGHAYTLRRGPHGEVVRFERDGKPPTVATIPFARVPTTAGDTWSTTWKGKKTTLTRLVGRPEVGFLDGAVVVRDGKAKGSDAAYVGTPARDLTFDADVRVTGSPGAIVLRAGAGSTTYTGVALFLEPGDAPRAELVAFDPDAGKIPLSTATPLGDPGPKGLRVHVVIRGDRVEAKIGDRTLSAKVPASFVGARGTIAFAPGARGEIEVRELRFSAR